jgi:hypothetical protein
LSCYVSNFLILVLVALIAELKRAKKALAEEKTVRLAVDKSFAEEKAAQQFIDQSLRTFEEAKAALNQDLLSVHASLTTTEENLLSKSSALDRVVIKELEAHIKLKATDKKMKAQEDQLESAQMAMSKREFSSSAVISSAVANAMALMTPPNTLCPCTNSLCLLILMTTPILAPCNIWSANYNKLALNY